MRVYREDNDSRSSSRKSRSSGPFALFFFFYSSMGGSRSKDDSRLCSTPFIFSSLLLYLIWR